MLLITNAVEETFYVLSKVEQEFNVLPRLRGACSPRSTGTAATSCGKCRVGWPTPAESAQRLLEAQRVDPGRQEEWRIRLGKLVRDLTRIHTFAVELEERTAAGCSRGADRAFRLLLEDPRRGGGLGAQRECNSLIASALSRMKRGSRRVNPPVRARERAQLSFFHEIRRRWAPPRSVPGHGRPALRGGRKVSTFPLRLACPCDRRPCPGGQPAAHLPEPFAVGIVRGRLAPGRNDELHAGPVNLDARRLVLRLSRAHLEAHPLGGARQVLHRAPQHGMALGVGGLEQHPGAPAHVSSVARRHRSASRAAVSGIR